MIWFVVALTAVCAAFSGTYIYSGDIWAATIAGALPALLYMAGLAVRAVCATASRICRIAVLLVALVILAGVSTQFAVMTSNTRWQHEQLQVIRSSIDRSMLMSTLFHHASPAFVAYHQQRAHKKHTIAEVFEAAWDSCDWSAPVVYLDSPPESLQVYASAGPGGAMILTGVSMAARGGDADFRNVNGATGFVQSRLTLSKEGMAYENEN